MPPRIALYYVPDPTDPLHIAASSWLGRDAETNAPTPRPNIPGLDQITQDAAHYGFHATLKPPMHLDEGRSWNDLLETARAIAASVPEFDLPPLAVTTLGGGFLALTETTPSPALQAFSDACVAGADHLRAPITPEDLARRQKSGPLPPAQERNLLRWGYPHVFATWQFHMTLTRRLTPAEQETYKPAAISHFAEALTHPRRVTNLAIFTQPDKTTPFTIAERLPLAK